MHSLIKRFDLVYMSTYLHIPANVIFGISGKEFFTLFCSRLEDIPILKFIWRCNGVIKLYKTRVIAVPDGHAGADRRADEAQADDAGEAPQAARAHAHAHADLSHPRIFSTVICCTQLLVLSQAINKNTATILYLFIIKHHDVHIVPAALAVFIPLYKNNLSSVILAAAILLRNTIGVAAFLGYSIILFLKPCDVYTFAVIVSVLIRLFIVTVRVIFNVLLSFM